MQVTIRHQQLLAKLLASKQRQALTWHAIALALGESKVWATAAILGQHRFTPVQAARAQALFDLDAHEALALQTEFGARRQTLPSPAAPLQSHEIRRWPIKPSPACANPLPPPPAAVSFQHISLDSKDAFRHI